MKKKWFKFHTLLWIMILGFVFVGCTQSKENTITEADKEELVENFLNEFFSFNNNERYENNDYAYLWEITTTECADKMQANRMPYKYDKLVVENGLTVEVENIEYEKVDENVYSFVITFKTNQTTDYFSTPVNGQVVVDVIDGEAFISSIVMYE